MGSKERLVLKADINATCEQTVKKIWEFRRLTTLWASPVCCRHSVPFTQPNNTEYIIN
jgi:hypothetical protein